MQKHLDFFNLLSKTHPIQQRALSETAEPDQVCAIASWVQYHAWQHPYSSRYEREADAQKASVM